MSAEPNLWPDDEQARGLSPQSSRIEDAANESPSDQLVQQLLAEPMNIEVLADAVERQEAADAADTLEDLPEQEAADVLAEMEIQAAADAVAEMEKPLAVRVIEDLVDEDNTAYAANLLRHMAPDDAVDLMQAMDLTHRDGLLRGMSYAQASKLRTLINYDPESAGGIMTTDYLALREELTVAQATDAVRRQPIPDEVQHLMVIDDSGKLRGMLSLRALLINKPEQRLHDLLGESVPAVRLDMDREAVAREFDRYDYAVMPVVDDIGRLIGVVTFDDVIDIIRREQTEDVQRTVGASAGEAVYSTLGEKFRGRLPWLVVNLFTSCLAAMVVLQFEDLIAELAVLAVLMPIIANQAGNAGQQALAVTLRGIVLDEMRAARIMPLLMREAAVGAINGLVGGTIIGLTVTLLGWLEISDASWELGIVAAISMAIALAIGCFAGSSIPLLMRRHGFDPAHGSSIFLTMITDSMSFFTFLGCASLLWRWMH